MKSVRIGAGLGFYGDAWEPIAASIERGGVQFIASDHLAELTLAILQKDRQRDPGLGYARDVVPLLMKLWPLMRERGVRFVCNAGGLNPKAAAQAEGLDVDFRIASGQDLPWSDGHIDVVVRGATGRQPLPPLAVRGAA